MRFCVLDSPDEIAGQASRRLARLVRQHDEPAVALPTGKTPRPFYRHLVREMACGALDLSRVHWLTLDEFFGPEVPEDATFRRTLENQFFRPASLPPERIHSPHPGCADPAAEARRYEALIKKLGGLRLAVLGIGTNGHIAFNEPGTPFGSRTGLRRLTAQTRQANRYLFPAGSPVPEQGMTMGISTILDAAEILLLATGPGKAEVLRRLQESKPHPGLPASALKTHGDCTVLADREAGRLLG